ncbi:zinc finger protein [Trichinella spiralis]|uniref:zinc finger protein n=1 Tax=Trichinella spiralis TaxID=6334 RepID=UPI0001EFC04D|nr:zinc finger protein [Trichinella spiralis]
MTSTYSCQRMSARWPLVIFYNIIDVSAYNAYVLWTEKHSAWNVGRLRKRRLFLEELGKALVQPEMMRRKTLPRTAAAKSAVNCGKIHSSHLQAVSLIRTQVVKKEPDVNCVFKVTTREAYVPQYDRKTNCASLMGEFDPEDNRSWIRPRINKSRLFEKLCEEMGSCHKSLLFHSEVRWLSRGKVLTRLVELREEVAIFLKRQNGNYCCFETLATFIVEKEATLDEDLISMIVVHLDSLKESFDYYFSEEMKFCDKNIWIVNPFQSDVVATGISTKADEELIDLSEDYSFKMSFDRKKLIQFWLSVENTYPTLSTAALKVLLPFTTSYMCEIRFSAMIGIKIKLRNKLQLSNNLRLKLTHISVDVEEVISQNRKQTHCSHTPHYASHE